MKILFIRWSALGDVVLTTGVLKTVRQHLPDAHIDFITSKALAPLLPKSIGIGNIYFVNKGDSSKQLSEVARPLPDYDFIFDWQGSLKSKLLCRRLRGPTYRIQKQSLVRRLFVRFRWGRKKLLKHVVEKYGELCFQPLGIPPQALETLRPCLDDGSIAISPKFKDLPKSFIAVHPFASQKNKEWPYFADLCETLEKMGEPVVIVGQSTEKSSFAGYSLVNNTSLNEMNHILGKAKALISTDSGPMHMGVAQNCPTLGIFGPTTKEFGFLPPFDKTRVLEKKDLACRPCHVHGGNSCPKKHFKCMTSIAPQDVISALAQMDLIPPPEGC